MKQKIKGFKGLLSILLCLVLIAQGVSGENINAATKVKINKTKASIYVGKTLQLKISGTKKKVTWKSSNKKIATVTSKGKVKGVKKGTAKITATVSKKKYTCKVTVKNKAVKVTPTPKPTMTVSPTVTSTVKPTPTPTIESTNVVTLPPTTPTFTPEINTIADNINKLKKYITENGSENSSGNKFIKWVDDDVLSCQHAIIYENNTDKLHFLTSVKGDDSNATISMYVDPMSTKDVFPELICIAGDNFAYKAIATVDMNTYALDTNVTFKNENGGNLDEYLQSLSNNYLRVSFLGWNILLHDRLNIGMKDIGFSAYGKEETTTPTETATVTPIITITPIVDDTQKYDYSYVSGKYEELKKYINENGETLSGTIKYVEDIKQLPNGETLSHNVQCQWDKLCFVANADSFGVSFKIDALNSNYCKVSVTSLDNNYTAKTYFETSKFVNDDSYLDTLKWESDKSYFYNEENKNFVKEVFSLSVNYCEQLLNEKVNMSLKDLGIGTGVVYATSTATPLPLTTPKPTATPKPQSLEERYDVVKDYFIKNGTKSDDNENNYIIKGSVMSNSKNYDYTITYKSDMNEFYALVACEYVKCNFTFNTLMSDEVIAEYRMLRWEPRYAGHEAKTTFKASEYDDKKELIWEEMGSSSDVVYTPTDEDMSDDLYDSYDIANFVFEKNIGLSLEDLGFGTNVAK